MRGHGCDRCKQCRGTNQDPLHTGNSQKRLVGSVKADGSYWTYGHDGRNRLTTADRYEAAGSSIRAAYAYTYDLGDNIATKTEPFLDDFEDHNYTGWTRSGRATWSASTGAMVETTADWTVFQRGIATGDLDLRFRYQTQDAVSGRYSNVVVRQSDSTHYVYLQLTTTSARLVDYNGGVSTTLDSNASAGSTAGV